MTVFCTAPVLTETKRTPSALTLTGTYELKENSELEDTLRNAVSSASRAEDLTLTDAHSGKFGYYIGGAVVITASAERGGFLSLLLFDVDGRYRVLELDLPTPEGEPVSETLPADYPTGEYILLGILSRRPIGRDAVSKVGRDPWSLSSFLKEASYPKDLSYDLLTFTVSPPAGLPAYESDISSSPPNWEQQWKWDSSLGRAPRSIHFLDVHKGRLRTSGLTADTAGFILREGRGLQAISYLSLWYDTSLRLEFTLRESDIRLRRAILALMAGGGIPGIDNPDLKTVYDIYLSGLPFIYKATAPPESLDSPEVLAFFDITDRIYPGRNSVEIKLSTGSSLPLRLRRVEMRIY